MSGALETGNLVKQLCHLKSAVLSSLMVVSMQPVLARCCPLVHSQAYTYLASAWRHSHRHTHLSSLRMKDDGTFSILHSPWPFRRFIRLVVKIGAAPAAPEPVQSTSPVSVVSSSASLSCPVPFYSALPCSQEQTSPSFGVGGWWCCVVFVSSLSSGRASSTYPSSLSCRENLVA
jgi:hypothetical protein